MTDFKSLIQRSRESKALWDAKDFNGAARVAGEARHDFETVDPSVRIVQLDDGRLGMCTAQDLESIMEPISPAEKKNGVTIDSRLGALHAKCAKALEEAEKVAP